MLRKIIPLDGNGRQNERLDWNGVVYAVNGNLKQRYEVDIAARVSTAKIVAVMPNLPPIERDVNNTLTVESAVLIQYLMKHKKR
jgi:hypothetical protein